MASDGRRRPAVTLYLADENGNTKIFVPVSQPQATNGRWIGSIIIPPTAVQVGLNNTTAAAGTFYTSIQPDLFRGV